MAVIYDESNSKGIMTMISFLEKLKKEPKFKISSTKEHVSFNFKKIRGEIWIYSNDNEMEITIRESIGIFREKTTRIALDKNIHQKEFQCLFCFFEELKIEYNYRFQRKIEKDLLRVNMTLVGLTKKENE